MDHSPYPPEDGYPDIPHDPDAERVLLTSICLAPDNPQVPDVLQLLNGGESFLVPQHKAIYLAFKSLHGRHEDPGPIALKAECEAQGTLNRAGGYTGIIDIVGASEETSHPLKPALRIHDLYRRRQLQMLTAKLQAQASDPSIATAQLYQELKDLAAVGPTKEAILTVVGAAEFLDHPAPEPKWLIPGLVLLGVPAVLASKGGLGKSFLALQMCIALAVGKAFLDFEAQAPMAVVYLGLEDGKEMFHRRFQSIVNHYKVCDAWTFEDDANLRRHFKAPFVNWSAPNATTYLPNLAPELEAILMANTEAGLAPGPAVIDTLARVSEGDENTVQALRPILNACSRLADHGYTPLMLHHVGKGQDGARAGKDKPTIADRMSTEWIRGSSAIVDNFRCTLQLAQIREDEADGAGLDPDRARQGQYLVFGATKTNGAPMGEMRLLEQDEAGRWFTPKDGAETLARLRGKKAVAALDKQTEVLVDLYEASRWGRPVDLAAVAKKHYPDKDFTKAKNALHQVISKLRRAGLLQKTSHVPTVQGMQKIRISEETQNEQ